MSVPVTIPDAVRALDPMRTEPAPDLDEELLHHVLRQPRSAPRTTPRRWGSLVAAAVLSIGFVGGGVAVAGQSLPDRFTDVFPWPVWGDEPAQSAELVVTVDGPQESDLSFWASAARGGQECINGVLSHPGRTGEDSLAGANPTTAFATCGDPRDGFSVFEDEQANYVVGGADGAARAVLTHADGEQTELAIVNGWMLGWYASSTGDGPTLTVTNEQGKVLWEATLPAGNPSAG